MGSPYTTHDPALATVESFLDVEVKKQIEHFEFVQPAFESLLGNNQMIGRLAEEAHDHTTKVYKEVAEQAQEVFISQMITSPPPEEKEEMELSNNRTSYYLFNLDAKEDSPASIIEQNPKIFTKRDITALYMLKASDQFF